MGGPSRSRALALFMSMALAFGCVFSAGAAEQAPAQARNVYIAGGQVRPAAPVAGDLAAAGGRVILDQAVAGDAALVGGSVDVRATVADDVRAAGGDISVETNVGGELFATGGNITLTRAAVVARAANLYGGNVTIDGRIDGPLTASAQKITINGEVRGNVRLMAGQIELGPQARLGGALTYSSGAELKRAEGATIAGPITRQETDARRGERAGERRPPAPGPAWVGALLVFLALLACAAVFLLVAPAFAAQSAQRVKTSPWLVLAVGFGALVAVPMLAVLLLITILGIPLGIVVLALYPVLLLAGFVVGVLFIANLVPPVLRQPSTASFAATMGFFALALLAIMLVSRLPVAGAVLVGLLGLAGIGGCILELYGRRQRPGGSQPVANPPVQPVEMPASRSS